MTASWLAQMGWETYVLDGGYDRALDVGPPQVLPKPDPSHRYRRPYEALTSLPARCRPISIGNMAWSNSFGAMRPMGSS